MGNLKKIFLRLKWLWRNKSSRNNWKSIIKSCYFKLLIHEKNEYLINKKSLLSFINISADSIQFKYDSRLETIEKLIFISVYKILINFPSNRLQSVRQKIAYFMKKSLSLIINLTKKSLFWCSWICETKRTKITSFIKLYQT